MEKQPQQETLVSLKGQFISAMPGLADPNFAQTVSCICEHTSEGAVGIVINRVHNSLKAGDIFKELNFNYTPHSAAAPVYVGGPVHVNEVFVLHQTSAQWHGILSVTPDIGVTNTADIVEAIAQGQGPQAYLICIGCAGWASGQLEQEIKRNAWLLSPVDAEIVFKLPVDIRWEESVKKMGIDPLFLSDSAGHA